MNSPDASAMRDVDHLLAELLHGIDDAVAAASLGLPLALVTQVRAVTAYARSPRAA